ncbi:hypothetical protein EMCRGX_G027628 [Ephydatia muelleri]|eukprot:Em0020g947a
MGRVSRYKRIKACDPFYKGTKKTETGVNLCPASGGDEQPVPKTLVRLMKRAEALTGKKKAVRAVDVTSKPEQATSTQPDQSFKRKDGESVKAYLNRIDVESNQHIMNLHKKNRKTREARKQYLEKRKKKFDEKRKKAFFPDEEIAKDRVSFGEVVQAPPKLTAKPRGKLQPLKHTPLLLENKLQPKAQQDDKGQCVGLKRKQDLEAERQAAIEAYRLAKQQRILKQ